MLPVVEPRVVVDGLIESLDRDVASVARRMWRMNDHELNRAEGLKSRSDGARQRAEGIIDRCMGNRRALGDARAALFGACYVASETLGQQQQFVDGQAAWGVMHRVAGDVATALVVDSCLERYELDENDYDILVSDWRWIAGTDGTQLLSSVA